MTEGAGLAPFVLAAERLSGVLDDFKIVAGGDTGNRLVVRGQTEEIDGNNGAGAEGFPRCFDIVLGPAVNDAPIGEGRLKGCKTGVAKLDDMG